jgi:hypothetical protein
VNRVGTERVTRLRQQAADKLEAAERAVVHALDNTSSKAISYLRGVQTSTPPKTVDQRHGE